MQVEYRDVTPPAPCPYLPGRRWSLDVRYVSDVRADEHEAELAAGSRRFGETYFRPACESCEDCVPIRVLVREFCPSKSQRRVLRRNGDVTLEIGEPRVDHERLELYERFHLDRHRRLGWPEPRTDPLEYYATFVTSVVRTHEFRFRLRGRLVGVAYVDEGAESLSSIYGFHDPTCSRRSLGTYDVLREVEVAREWSKRYLYLGYLVSGCRSMEYKAAFWPHEVLVAGCWARVSR